MENNTAPIEALFVKAEDYSKTTVELFKLQAVDKSADVISFLATQFAIFVVCVLFVSTISIGLALWIGEMLGAAYYGFFVVGGFYVFVTLLLYIFRDQWIRTPITNSIIMYVLKKKVV